MSLSLHIRPFCAEDAPVLRALFHASVHGIARRDYTPEQLRAWAPQEHDAAAWAERLRANQPWVADVAAQARPGLEVEPAPVVAGFADLQPNGYIDQFFVSPAFAGRGVARALMAHLQALAAQRGMAQLWAHVSLTAEPFFAAQGFAVIERREVERAGVVLRNAHMAKRLGSECS